MDKVRVVINLPKEVKEKAKTFKNYQEALNFVIKKINYNYIRALMSRKINLTDVDLAKVLKKHMGICWDQTLLACAFLYELGYEYQIIGGNLSTTMGQQFHSWLRVKIKGEWRICDPTWGTKYQSSDYRATTIYEVKWEENCDEKES